MEIFLGMLYIALTTGLVFSKFALPKSKILFTSNILMTDVDGEKSLVFRLANGRSNKIMDAQISLHLLFDDQTKEGLNLRRFEELSLVKKKTPYFSLSLLGMHKIAEGALAGLSLDQMQKKQVEFIVSVKGIDETYGQSIHATKLYTYQDIVRDAMFEDILEIGPQGQRTIDFSKFDSIVYNPNSE